MTFRTYISAALAWALLGCTKKPPPVVVAPPPRTDVQLTKAATPVEVYPATAVVPSGERRMFFARIITPKEKQFRFDSDLFEWSIVEPQGGTLKPLPGSRLYYVYTAPRDPGEYHLKIVFKENARFEAGVLVRVDPDPATLARKVNGSALPQ